MQVLAILRAAQEPSANLEGVFCSILQKLNPLYESNHTRWQDLVEFLIGWAHNRRPKQERGRWQSLAEQHIQEEERKREIKNMGQTIADSIFEEGSLTTLHKVLLRLGRKYLGEPEAATIQVLNTIKDLERLERMIEVVAEQKSWSDLMAIS